MQMNFNLHSWNWAGDFTVRAIFHEPIYKSQIRVKKSFSEEHKCAKCLEAKSITLKD